METARQKLRKARTGPTSPSSSLSRSPSRARYEDWSIPDLARKVRELERELQDAQKQGRPPVVDADPSQRTKKKAKAFDASKYCTRFVALKFAYLGQNYNGLEYHKGGDTPLPTVEEELWKALVKSKLVNPSNEGEYHSSQPDFDGLEYSKCGRTDKGVSAFGQVVALRVRSAKLRVDAQPLIRSDQSLNAQAEIQGDIEREETCDDNSALENPFGSISLEQRGFHPVADELPYTQILNRLLPPDIRILAWCPDPPPNFNARFSCKERRYKYFFTNPAFPVDPAGSYPKSSRQQHDLTLGTTPLNDGSSGSNGFLDISAMQSACKQLVGLHDFRNFCKLDPTKQLTNFERRVFHASIEPVSPSDQPAAALNMPSPHDSLIQDANEPGTPSLYALTIHGTAFLWHQIRHIAAILFLIGQGLEPPSLIPDLLDTSHHPQKPHYEMADDRPLVLWDCIFPSSNNTTTTKDDHASDQETLHGYEDALNWIYVGDEARTAADLAVSTAFTSSKPTGPDRAITNPTELVNFPTTAPQQAAKSKQKHHQPPKPKPIKDPKFGPVGLVPDLWSLWRQRKIDEVLAGEMLNVVVRQGRHSLPQTDGHDAGENGIAVEGRVTVQERGGGAGGGVVVGGRGGGGGAGSQKVFLGGDSFKLVGKYVPILQRARMESVEVLNARWVEKGRGRKEGRGGGGDV